MVGGVTGRLTISNLQHRDLVKWHPFQAPYFTLVGKKRPCLLANCDSNYSLKKSALTLLLKVRVIGSTLWCKSTVEVATARVQKKCSCVRELLLIKSFTKMREDVVSLSLSPPPLLLPDDLHHLLVCLCVVVEEERLEALLERVGAEAVAPGVDKKIT